MMTIFRHCLFHDHLVDIVVILVVGAKSHNGTQAQTVWEENLKYDQLYHDYHHDDHYDYHHDYHFEHDDHFDQDDHAHPLFYQIMM